MSTTRRAAASALSTDARQRVCRVFGEDYDPTAWTGVRLPHAWLEPGLSLLDLPGRAYTVLDMSGQSTGAGRLSEAVKRLGAPAAVVTLGNDRLRDLLGRDVFLIRPDLHIAWRGNAIPDDVDGLARTVTGHASAI